MQDRKGLVQQEALGPAEQQNYLFVFLFNSWKTPAMEWLDHSATLRKLQRGDLFTLAVVTSNPIFQEKVEEAKKLNQGKENKERRIGIQATVNDSKQ